MTLVFGGVEAGGTKFVCAVATVAADGRAVEIQTQERFQTTTPEESIGRVIRFFRDQALRAEAIGIGSFGPVDLDPESATYGYITATPKPYWSNADLVGPIGRALGVPVGFDTDVNAAALGEWRWGAAQGLANFVYLTIGTGIGGGGMINGRLMHGLIHPEMGHMRLPHDWEADPFPGRCPFHGDCLEGMASGPAIKDRWGRRAPELADDHPAWDLEAHYLALGLTNLICTLSPQRIILGGGVMKQPQLLPLVRQKTLALLNDYVQSPAILEEIDRYIVRPGLGDEAGVLGSVALAQAAAG
jgi:fructokinase